MNAADKELTERLRAIEVKIDFLREALEQYLKLETDHPAPPESLSPSKVGIEARNEGNAQLRVYLLRLPDSLRRTMLVMERLGEATTVDVARETGRSRSVESIHLNQLERMGYLEKYRKGRKIYFKISRPLIKGAETDSRRRSNELS